MKSMDGQVESNLEHQMPPGEGNMYDCHENSGWKSFPPVGGCPPWRGRGFVTPNFGCMPRGSNGFEGISGQHGSGRMNWEEPPWPPAEQGPLHPPGLLPPPGMMPPPPWIGIRPLNSSENLHDSSTNNPLGIDLSGDIWVETKSDDSGKYYYYNAASRETTWTKPEGDNIKILRQDQVERLTHQISQAEPTASCDRPPPNSVTVDRNNDYVDNTNVPPPMGMPPPGFMANPYGGPPPFVSPMMGYPPWGMPPPWQIPPGEDSDTQEVCDWTEHISPDGKKYYYNSKTLKSVWDKPAELTAFETRNLPRNDDSKMKSSVDESESVVHSETKINEEKVLKEVQTIQDEEIGPFMETDDAKVSSSITNKDVNSLTSSSPVLDTSSKEAPVTLSNASSTTSIFDRPKPPQDKSRPVSSSPVSGTPWCVVWTGDERSFFYNPTTKVSVWERPTELLGRPDVDEMLISSISAENMKKKVLGLKVVDENERSEDVLILSDEKSKSNTKSVNDVNKEAAIEAEVKAARERTLIPLESRMKQFRDLLTEKKISAFSTWEKELHKIVFDPRYLLLTSKERKQVFERYVKERVEEERREKKLRLKANRDDFMNLLEEAHLHCKSTFGEFSNKYGRDERFRAIEKLRERESLFNAQLIEVRRQDKEDRVAKSKLVKKRFMEMLQEIRSIDRHSYWGDVRKCIESDRRYKDVESSCQREDFFMDYICKLKEDHRREKERRKRKTRSKSPPRHKNKRSRSRSRDRKHKKSRGDEDITEGWEKGGIRKRDQSRQREREEGEMSEDNSHDQGRENGDERTFDDTSKPPLGGLMEKEDNGDEDEEAATEKRLKQERVEASLRKREADVQKELSGHLYARDKEREQHRHLEAVSHFQALLTDLIRHPDFSWKEAKRMLKKDGRYEATSKSLSKSDREQIFDEHVDSLIARKKDNFRKLLDDCKVIRLNSSFKDVKKLIKDDPRYSKYSSSDRKCEKQFNEYLKIREAQAITSFRQLLLETKKITDKSLQLIKDPDSVHMQEIGEILGKDKRYLDLDSVADVRTEILMSYLEDMEKRGPPPPPTASEPSRRFT